MKKFFSHLVKLLRLLFLALSAGTLMASQYQYRWVEKGELANEREVFLCAFTQLYKGIPLTVLGVKDLNAFLQEAFDDEVKALNDPHEGVFLVEAHTKDTVVGFLTCNKETSDTIYVRQMAVSPSFWRKGVGRALIQRMKERFSNVKKIVLVTRRINDLSCKFYEGLGFTQASYVHQGLDPKKYVGYECAVK